MKQQSLFNSENLSLKEDIKLVISKSKNKILSRVQITFNKYSKKIEALRKQLETDKNKYDKLISYFSTKASPLQIAYYNEIINLVKALFSIYKLEKLSNLNKKKLEDLILSNLDEAFQYIIPTEEVIAIYNDLSPISFEEEESEQIEYMKEMMEDLFKSKFGFDLDLSDVDMKNEEVVARKMAEIQDRFKSEEANRNENHTKKKTKKEIELELKNKQTEDLQNKNIRNIYMSLVKMLHPDLETDEILKLEREELLKKVTAAYQNKDLHTLLKLEIEIIHKQSENLNHLTDEKLLFLNSALKEQIDELKEEIEILRDHPRYEAITDYLHLPEVVAIRSINSEISELTTAKAEVINDIKELTGENKKKYITSILKTVDNHQTNDFDINPSELRDFLDFLGNNMNGSSNKKSNKTKSKKRR